MPTKKISISFSDHYIDIYNYLKTKENISYYICQLVRYEMTTKDTISPDLKVQIEQAIEEILKDKHLTITNQSENEISPCTQNPLTNDDISLIKDLF